MPIRFRCAYCNQLMGIARRKVGTVVRCTTCSGQVVVPSADTEPPNSPPPAAGGDAPNLFERSDFDEVLRPKLPAVRTAAGTIPAGAAGPLPNAPSGAWGTHAEPPLPMQRVDEVAVAAPAPARASPAPTNGVFVSTRRLTILAILVSLMMGLVFAAGVLVGKFVL